MSEQKTILTPEYWKRPEYQPLVEHETVYGNKVRIPECWLKSLEWMKNLSRQEKAESLKRTIEKRGYQAADFARVLLEIYQPRPYGQQTPLD